MANTLTTNPLVVDTTGVLVAYPKPVKVKGFTVQASAAAWVAKFSDDTPAANTVFSLANSETNQLGGHYVLNPPTVWRGLNAVTLTNITQVLVHLA